MNVTHFLHAQMRDSKKFPMERAQNEVAKMSPVKFMVHNFHGLVKSPQQLRNIKREAKMESLNKRGIILSGEVGAIEDAMTKTEKLELTRRSKAGDNTRDMPGIVRFFSLRPVQELVLHSKVAMTLMAELTKIENNGRANGVFTIDATGNLSDILKNSGNEGKCQHLLITAQLSETVLSAGDAKHLHEGDQSIVCISERISPTNTTAAISQWIAAIKNDCETVGGKMYRGFKSLWGMVKADGAVEIATGVLLGLRDEGQVSTAQEYCNMVCIVLLRYESMAADITNSRDMAVVRGYAQKTIETIQERSPTLIKQCDVHGYLAQHDGRKTMKNKPVELRLHPNQVDRIFAHFASHLRKEPKLCRVLARLCALLSLFGRKSIPCPNIDVNSETREHHDESESRRICTAMHGMIDKVAGEMLIESDDRMMELLNEENAKRTMTKSKRVFDALSFTNNAIETMKKEMEVATCYAYQIDKEKKKAAVNIAIVYSCFKINDDGDLIVAPRLVGGFSHQVDLPFTAGEIPFPLHSERSFDYWKMWANQAPLWAPPITECAKLAWDRGVLYESSMSIESYIGIEKHFTSDLRGVHGHCTALIHDRMDRSFAEGRRLVQNYREYPSRVDARVEREVKKINATDATDEINPLVQSEEQANGDTGLKWARSKKKAGIKSLLKIQRDEMITAINKAKLDKNLNIKDENKETWRVAIAEFGARMDQPEEFMKRATFYDFVEDTRKSNLKDKDVKVLDAFYKYYVGTESGK